MLKYLDYGLSVLTKNKIDFISTCMIFASLLVIMICEPAMWMSTRIFMGTLAIKIVIDFITRSVADNLIDELIKLNRNEGKLS